MPSSMFVAYEEYAESHCRNNCLKGVKWSPDGACLLTASEDQKLRLFELPQSTVQGQVDSGEHATGELRSTLCVNEGDSIYDYCWYPLMDSAAPVTCCFVSTARDHPIHMWDAYDGSLRATYTARNHLDEVASAFSVAFEPTGNRFYCGFERAVRIFDISRPGLAVETRATSKSRRSHEGQRGIISCIHFSPDYSGLYAAGSFAGSTGLYVENAPGLIALLGGHTGGVTQVRFSHDGLYLFTAARCDGRILLWDARNTCQVLASFERRASTNQRIGFDLSADSRGLITASQDGRVLVYDCTQPEQPPAVWLTFGEAANAAALHPSLPLLAVAVGERRFSLQMDGDEALQGAHVDSKLRENGFSIWQLPQAPTTAGESVAAHPAAEGARFEVGTVNHVDGAPLLSCDADAYPLVTEVEKDGGPTAQAPAGYVCNHTDEAGQWADSEARDLEEKEIEGCARAEVP
eukprot:CAMPEP_0119374216 /NCGR_PEP_ID=MMETSP1334-20130426/30008_1 /TAXON_ID=127549 /ORGANISM="Calcidiscus leptoporus, Strain RCC1130" /LENGTH=462 /DNA_ID=CAMNT_0007392223 /DNA_START=78 /DNA_END=1466 /DNA_ORIENTATION=-